MKEKLKILSFDAETNGLYGQAFALGAVVNDGTKTIEYVARCPVVGEVNQWVADNVLPNIEDIPTTHESYTSMIGDFWDFYSNHKEDAEIIAHMAYPVEAKVLRDMVETDLESRMFQGPFPLQDVASVLRAKEFDPTSVDAYICEQKLTVPFEGNSHHPLYDAWVGEVVYRDLLQS